jgi:hypothetical protein
MREVVGRLIREDSHVPLVDAEMSQYFHDVYDHVLDAVETIDSTHERVGTILDTDMNEHSNQLNEITKKLAPGPPSSRCPPRSLVGAARTRIRASTDHGGSSSAQR